MRKVETETILGDQAALLRYMAAQSIAKRGVQQVRRAMIGADAVEARGIDRQVDRVADLQRAALDRRLMRVQPPTRLAGVADTPRHAAHPPDRRAAAPPPPP